MMQRTHPALRMPEIMLVNWWKQELRANWLVNFLAHHGIASRRPIALASVFGPRDRIEEMARGRHLVFFTGEHVGSGRFEAYEDYCHGIDGFRLAIGFRPDIGVCQVRFPLWMFYMFSPSSSEAAIRKRVDQLCQPIEYGAAWLPRSRFAALIARHDRSGVRSCMIEALAGVGSVRRAGKFRRNSRSLQWLFRDRKIDYLRMFKFNLCPENVNEDGYVTEKLFECIAAGCLPIYQGGLNRAEPCVLNQDAILYWPDESSRQAALVERIRELIAEPRALRELQRLPRLRSGAADVVIQAFRRLEAALRGGLA